MLFSWGYPYVVFMLWLSCLFTTVAMFSFVTFLLEDMCFKDSNYLKKYNVCVLICLPPQMFPLQDKTRLQSWVGNMNRQKWTQSRHQYLCCGHIADVTYYCHIQQSVVTNMQKGMVFWVILIPQRYRLQFVRY